MATRPTWPRKFSRCRKYPDEHWDHKWTRSTDAEEEGGGNFYFPFSAMPSIMTKRERDRGGRVGVSERGGEESKVKKESTLISAKHDAGGGRQPPSSGSAVSSPPTSPSTATEISTPRTNEWFHFPHRRRNRIFIHSLSDGRRRESLGGNPGLGY